MIEIRREKLGTKGFDFSLLYIFLFMLVQKIYCALIVIYFITVD